MSTNGDADNENEVESIIKDLLQLRRERRVKEADILKHKLLDEHSVQVFYQRCGDIAWRKVDKDNLPSEKRVVWSVVEVRNDVHNRPLPSECKDIPLIIATANTPHYRSRLAETMNYLSIASFEDGTYFKPKPMDLLNLSDHPSIGANRVLFEGWRQILLPTLLSSPEVTTDDTNIILIGEDDIRLGDISPGRMRELCSAVFDSNPDIHVLSLGHAYALAKPSRRQRRWAKKQNEQSSMPMPTSLYSLLQQGKKIHATTLIALRHPEGTKALLDAMQIGLKKTLHFDQFLFHSTLHNLDIAVSEPPLVGWAEVTETLSSVGSGSRRMGGGRKQQLPPKAAIDDVQWLRRTVE